MDGGTMKDYIEDLIIKVNDACKAMEEAEILVAGLRAEIEHWKKIASDLKKEVQELKDAFKLKMAIKSTSATFTCNY